MREPLNIGPFLDMEGKFESVITFLKQRPNGISIQGKNYFLKIGTHAPTVAIRDVERMHLAELVSDQVTARSQWRLPKAVNVEKLLRNTQLSEEQKGRFFPLAVELENKYNRFGVAILDRSDANGYRIVELDSTLCPDNVNVFILVSGNSQRTLAYSRPSDASEYEGLIAKENLESEPTDLEA